MNETGSETTANAVVETVAGLREYADWLESNRDELIAVGFRFDAGHIYCYTLREFAAAVTLLGAPTETVYPEGDDKFVRVYRHFGPKSVYAYITAEQVCEKITTTTTEVVERVEWTLRPIMVLPERTEQGFSMLAATAIRQDGRTA